MCAYTSHGGHHGGHLGFLGKLQSCSPTPPGPSYLSKNEIKPSLHTNYHLKSKWQPTNVRYLTFENILRFSVLRFLRGRSQELQECHKFPSKSSYAVFVRAVLPRSYVDIYLKRPYIKRRPWPSPCHEANFFRNIQNQGGVDHTNWTLCLCPFNLKMFSSSWLSL